MVRVAVATISLLVLLFFSTLVMKADDYSYLLLSQCLVFSLWAVAYNLVYGYMGEISFGHAAYFGIGAYSVPLLMGLPHVSFGAALFIAPFCAGIVALFVAVVLRGTRGIYFAIATFVFAQGIYILALKWTDVTGGDNGLPVSRPDLLGDSRSYAIFLLILVGVAMAALLRITESPAGHVIVAIRENERRANQIGYDTTSYRVLLFGLSGFFSGLAGALFSPLIYFVSPDVLFWVMSGQVIIMTIVGGSHVFFGPIVGAVFLILVQDTVSGLSGSTLNIGGFNVATIGQHWPLILGLIFYIIILFEPQGIVGLGQSWVLSFARARHDRLRSCKDATNNSKVPPTGEDKL